MTRYARQIAVPAFGPAGQARLVASSALVIGAGGLAAPVLQYLVGAGLGRITLVDADTVSLSNLHRQTLFRMDDIGKPKVQAAKHHMAALNPNCNITALATRLDPANAERLCQGVDVVLDCADTFATSYVLSDTCSAMTLPLISASVVGIEGYVGGFCGSAPSLRAVFPDLPERLGSCDADGVIGPIVGIIGALQAQMALAVLAGLTPSPLGQLASFDADAFRFGGFRFDGAPEPATGFRFIAPSQTRQSDRVIDLRHADEPGPELPGATRILPADLTANALGSDTDRRIVFACRSGLRAWQSAEKCRAYWPGNISLMALGDG